ncbi:MAG: HAD family hydrolase [Dehalococcoidia bacterium]|nr:HAD family hydrolase [Dehalococcoidia bacterium]
MRRGRRALTGASGASPAIEAVIFDWGGTLAHYAAVELADMWRLAARHLAGHMETGEEQIMARLAAVEQRMWERTASDARSASLGDLLAEATHDLGADIAAAVLEQAGTHYLDAWTPHIVHDAEAAPMLRALRARGVRIGLLSNTHWPPAYHERFLARDGLDGLIDARLYTSTMPFMKPHPEAFRRALDALGVADAGRAVYVGDRLFDDVHGAQRAGLRAVHRVNPAVPPYAACPDATITRLAELPPIIERWLQGGASRR